MVTGNSINARTSGIQLYDGAGTYSATTVTQYNALVGGASNAITSIPLANGQILVGSSGVVPVAATITAGVGIGVTNAAGSITINATGGGLTWSTVTGTTQVAAADNGYVINNGALVTVTLPATCPLYSTITLVGLGAGGWSIAQNASQYVQVGSVASAVGVGGSVASTSRYDTVTLVCTLADTSFSVISVQGNLTVV